MRQGFMAQARARARRWIPALLAVTCAALAGVLVLGAVDVWREGAALRAEDPAQAVYTPERVAARLSPAGPLALLALGLTLAGRALGAGSTGRESSAGGASPAPRKGPREDPRRRALRWALLAAAGAALAAGACTGGLRETLYKAIRICAECIGLG